MNCCHIKNVFLYKNNLLSQSHYFVYQKTVTIKSHVVWHILFLFFFRNCPNFLYSPFPWNKLKLHTYFSLFLSFTLLNNVEPLASRADDNFLRRGKTKTFCLCLFCEIRDLLFRRIEWGGEEEERRMVVYIYLQLKRDWMVGCS